MLGALKALFYGGTKGFRPYEKQCLDWLGEHLPEEGRKILRAQIEAVEVIQRTMRDQEAACFFPKQGSGTVHFPNEGLELPAARLVLRATDQPPIFCEIFLHDGLLHQLQFSLSPKVWRDVDFSSERVEIFADLMKPDARERRPATGEAILPEKLQGQDVKDLAAPASESEIDILVRRLGPALPQDYLDLLRITDGFELELWKVNGLRTATRVFPDEGSCTWLAEGEALDTSPSSLVILHKDTEPRVYLRDEEYDKFTDLGGSFLDALLEAALGEYEDSEE